MLGISTLPKMHDYTIRDAVSEDSIRLAEIYHPYVLNTAISFEELPVGATEMAARLGKLVQEGLPWLVAEYNGTVVGYAYATKWRERHAYRFSVECTVYVAESFHGKRVGNALYGALFQKLKFSGYHSVLAVIALPNSASIGLHEKFGMQKVAHFSQVGFKLGAWHDVGNWQVIL